MSVVHSAELVDAGVHALRESLPFCERLDAPRHRDLEWRLARLTGDAGVDAILRDKPVGQHHAAELVLVAQLFGQQLLVKSGTDLLDRRAINLQILHDVIRRHDTDHTGRERAEKRLYVLCELSAGKSGVAAVVIVPIKAVG